jgi:hypothetical protein
MTFVIYTQLFFSQLDEWRRGSFRSIKKGIYNMGEGFAFGISNDADE